jgi:hypothetical protein
MKKIFMIFLMVVLSLNISAENNKPKIFFDIETGERYMEVESDYTDYDYNIDQSYTYQILKFGYKQKIANSSMVSAIIKHNDKSYIYSGDKDKNNYSNSLLAYYKKSLRKNIDLKFETTVKDRKFDEISAKDNENYWYSSGVSIKIKPTLNTNFFNSPDNIYYLKIFYKEQNYRTASEKNTSSKGLTGNWQININEQFRIKSRFRYYLKRYDTENNIRQNSDKYNVGVRFEYDFNE